jgi:hypothetical protein
MIGKAVRFGILPSGAARGDITVACPACRSEAAFTSPYDFLRDDSAERAAADSGVSAVRWAAASSSRGFLTCSLGVIRTILISTSSGVRFGESSPVGDARSEKNTCSIAAAPILERPPTGAPNDPFSDRHITPRCLSPAEPPSARSFRQ